jgi:hypothetical protein
MKRLKAFVTAAFLLIGYMAKSQKIILVQDDVNKKPLYASSNMVRFDTLSIKLNFASGTYRDTTIKFKLDNASMPASTRPVLVKDSITIPAARFNVAPGRTLSLDTFLLLQERGTTDTLKRDESARP